MRKIGIIVGNITLRNGTERAVVNLANLLADNYDIFILSLYSQNGNTSFFLKDKVEIIHMGFLLSGKNNFLIKWVKYYLHNRLVYKYLVKLQNEMKFDCFIGTHFSINFIISNLKKIKKIGCEHFNYKAANIIARFFRRFFYLKLDKVVVLTKADSRNYNFINSRKLAIIPNSISFNPSPGLPNYSSKKLISIGRLTFQKGYDMLIEVCGILKKYTSDWKLEIIGEGEDYDFLQSRIKDLELENNVCICPPTDQIESIYKSACCYIMSSRFEGLPMVLLEAQICGLPCISFDCPEGPSEVIQNGVNGFLIEADNIGEMSKSILKILSDEKMCQCMGKNAISYVKKFSPDIVQDKWITLLNSL